MSVKEVTKEVSKSSVKIANETRIKIFENIGIISAIILGIAYVAVAYMLYWGINIEKTIGKKDTIVFLIVSAVIGFLVSLSLSYQGWTWASNEPENKEIIIKKRNPKVTKGTSSGVIWTVIVIKGLCMKVAPIIATLYLAFDFALKGIRNQALIVTVVINLLLWIAFGFLGMTSTYNVYNDKYIPYLKNKIKKQEKKDA